jgi:hypothetical protein
MAANLCPGGDFEMMPIICLTIGAIYGFCTCAILSVDNYEKGFEEGREWERSEK